MRIDAVRGSRLWMEPRLVVEAARPLHPLLLRVISRISLLAGMRPKSYETICIGTEGWLSSDDAASPCAPECTQACELPIPFHGCAVTDCCIVGVASTRVLMRAGFAAVISSLQFRGGQRLRSAGRAVRNQPYQQFVHSRRIYGEPWPAREAAAQAHPLRVCGRARPRMCVAAPAAAQRGFRRERGDRCADESSCHRLFGLWPAELRFVDGPFDLLVLRFRGFKNKRHRHGRVGARGEK